MSRLFLARPDTTGGFVPIVLLREWDVHGIIIIGRMFTCEVSIPHTLYCVRRLLKPRAAVKCLLQVQEQN